MLALALNFNQFNSKYMKSKCISRTSERVTKCLASSYPVLVKLVLILRVLSPCLKFIHGAQVLAWLSFHATFETHLFHMKTRTEEQMGTVV